jgi:hypothetical protein
MDATIEGKPKAGRNTGRSRRLSDVHTLPGARRDWDLAARWGGRLAEALRARGMTALEASERLGMAPARVYEYVGGARMLPLDTLIKIVDTLELDPFILFPTWREYADRPPAGRIGAI